MKKTTLHETTNKSHKTLTLNQSYFNITIKSIY